jgi:transcription initiation factor IIE alpha subunit
MSHIESALMRLAEGTFVCEVAYPDEYAALSTPEGRQKAEDWLGAIGYRLARLGDEGAYFMAHAIIVSTEVRAKIREEMRTIRDRLEPAVGFLETLRQAQGRNPQLQPGDVFWESEISEAVRTNAMLERRLNEMRDIHGTRSSESAIDRVKRILALLEDDGYIVVTNPNHRAYRVTGKVSYLYQLLAVIAENTTHLEESAVSDQMEAQGELLRKDAAA